MVLKIRKYGLFLPWLTGLLYYLKREYVFVYDFFALPGAKEEKVLLVAPLDLLPVTLLVTS